MSRRVAFLAGFLVLALALALPAERAWVGNRGGATVDFFDTSVNPGALEGSVIVGSGPVDICSDSPDNVGPFRLFVANASSNTVSVLSTGDSIGAVATLTGGGSFGTFGTPSGLFRAAGGLIVLVDQKTTTAVGFGGAPTTGKSTIRLLHPRTYSVIEDFRDASPTARYSDVVSTSNNRIWVADPGDGGVTVVRVPSGPAPWGMAKSIVYQGSGEFADFVHDPVTAAPTYLIAPRRLATNGTTLVLVADGGSDNVSILDAEYPAGAETAALLANVSLGLPAGGVCRDIRILGDFAYVTASNSPFLFRIDLTTYAVGIAAIPFLADGIGVTSDGLKFYVGEAAGPLIQEINPVTMLAVGAAFGFGGSIPSAWYSSVRTVSEVPSSPGGSLWVSTSNSGAPSGGSGDCGLLGAELLLVLGALRLRRRRS